MSVHTLPRRYVQMGNVESGGIFGNGLGVPVSPFPGGTAASVGRIKPGTSLSLSKVAIGAGSAVPVVEKAPVGPKSPEQRIAEKQAAAAKAAANASTNPPPPAAVNVAPITPPPSLPPSMTVPVSEVALAPVAPIAVASGMPASNTFQQAPIVGDAPATPGGTVSASVTLPEWMWIGAGVTFAALAGTAIYLALRPAQPRASKRKAA